MKLSIITAIDGRSSFSIHARQMIGRLPKFDIEPIIRPISGTSPDAKPGPNDAEVEIIWGHPTIAPTAGKKTIYVTAWESTRLPKQSVTILNQCQAVVVPSTYCATVFSACGVNTPIHVVPLGVSDIFRPQPWPNTLKCVFACAGHLGNGATRKGLSRIVEAFQKAFEGRTDVALNVKVFPGETLNVNDPRISVVSKFMLESELLEWMAQAHCFVAFGTGAFEAQAFEFAAIRRPVIAIKFGGLADYMDSFIGVDCRLTPANDRWTGLGLFAEPILESAISVMRRVAMNPHYYVRRTSLLTWDDYTNRIARIVRDTMNRPKLVIQLGRHGDIINILPAIREMSMKDKRPVSVMVARDYAKTLEGLSYVDAVQFDGHFSLVKEAEQKAKAMGYQDILVSQVYGKDHHYKTECSNFNQESYRLLGASESFNTARLVMDNRNFEREAEIAERVLSKDKPNVLVNLNGNSSPFHAAATFFLCLKDRLPGINLVDIGALQCESIQDLLGLYDRACCLLTIDTSTLHLARSHPIPVVALLREGWHGTNPACNVALSLRYELAWSNLDLIVREIKVKSEYPPHPQILHLWQRYESKHIDTFKREVTARQTWDAISEIGVISFDPDNLPNAIEIGDTVNAPDVKAVLDQGILNRKHDIILLSNNDACVFPDAAPIIRKAVNQYGCYYSQRIDVDKVTLPLDPKLLDGHSYAGADLFAFTYDWWRTKRGRFPNLYFGFEGFDFILQRLMEESGFVKGKPVIVHQKHESSNWKLQNERPAQKHNRSECRKWAKENGYAQWLLPEDHDFIFKASL